MRKLTKAERDEIDRLELAILKTKSPYLKRDYRKRIEKIRRCGK